MIIDFQALEEDSVMQPLVLAGDLVMHSLASAQELAKQPADAGDRQLSHCQSRHSVTDDFDLNYNLEY